MMDKKTLEEINRYRNGGHDPGEGIKRHVTPEDEEARRKYLEDCNLAEWWKIDRTKKHKINPQPK